MHGNYEWQKRYAAERIQARMNDAERHRLAAKSRIRGSYPALGLARQAWKNVRHLAAVRWGDYRRLRQESRQIDATLPNSKPGVT